jgi:UDP-N-acetylmuramoylalanine--D-glutamate ligase
MLIKDLLEKKILIWGYGFEGKATLQFLLKHNIKNKILIANAVEIKENIDNVEFIIESDILKYNFDVVIKSPGVSYYKDEIKILQDRGILITSTLNIFLAETQNAKNLKTIAITGTKGKSTTAMACYHILKNIGYNVAFAGNMEVSFFDYIDYLDKYDYFVLELSSYQVTNMLYDVDYSIVLNLFNEHIDWHKSHDNYFRDKMNINNFSKNRIVNANSQLIKKYLKDEINYIYFNTENGFHLTDNFIYKASKKLFNIDKLSNIKGRHILENFNSLFTVLDMENIDLNGAFESLKSFEMLEHRLEVFYEDKKRKIVFVDDSISTIPEATIECLKTFSDYDNIRLVLGGFDRKQNYDDMINIIKNNKKIKLYLLGETGKRLEEKLNNCIFFDKFEDLIIAIIKDIEDNTAILLSPASTSYDMFKNFKERGDIFKKRILEIYSL